MNEKSKFFRRNVKTRRADTPCCWGAVMTGLQVMDGRDDNVYDNIYVYAMLMHIVRNVPFAKYYRQ